MHRVAVFNYSLYVTFLGCVFLKRETFSQFLQELVLARNVFVFGLETLYIVELSGFRFLGLILSHWKSVLSRRWRFLERFPNENNNWNSGRFLHTARVSLELKRGLCSWEIYDEMRQEKTELGSSCTFLSDVLILYMAGEGHFSLYTKKKSCRDTMSCLF